MIQPEGSAGGLAVGTVVGETYRLERLIGQGGMGAVWEATHLRLPGKRVAVKVLLQTIKQGSEAFTRFRREAEIASRLGHANIVEVLDFNVLPDGTPYLVLELLHGENLADRLRRGPLQLEEAMAVVRQIGLALATAHKHGVIHRDLKPENVYLVPVDESPVPRVKVLDFGISKIAGSSSVQTQEQRVLGTPQYMAPEQAKGMSSAVDARSDVFSLGVMVYEMLSGRPCFDGENLAAVVFKVVYEEPAPLELVAPGVPAHVLAAVKRALAKFPDARFPDVSSFVEALTGKALSTSLDRGPPGTSKPPPVRSSDPGAFAPTVGTGSEALSATVNAPSDSPGPLLARESQQVTHSTRKSRPWLWALPAVLAGGAVYVATRPSAPVAVVALQVDAAPPPAPVDAAPPDAMPPSPPDAAVAVVAKPARPERPERDDDDHEDLGGAARFLAEADQAFAAGDYREAIRLAIRSLNEKKTRRAHHLAARAYCRLGDLGNAKAQARALRPRGKSSLVAYCLRYGVDLRD